MGWLRYQSPARPIRMFAKLPACWGLFEPKQHAICSRSSIACQQLTNCPTKGADTTESKVLAIGQSQHKPLMSFPLNTFFSRQIVQANPSGQANKCRVKNCMGKAWYQHICIPNFLIILINLHIWYLFIFTGLMFKQGISNYKLLIFCLILLFKVTLFQKYGYYLKLTNVLL